MCVFNLLHIKIYFAVMELHLDIPQDVPIIPNKKLKLLGGGGQNFQHYCTDHNPRSFDKHR